MAIGKPLLVSERKGVAQPVLSAQTQQLSSNVPVQKIAMADYSIGMNNAMSSFAVTKELANMVDAGVKAKMYIDQTKQQYARLNLMEDWQKTDNDFRTAFAKAITPEEQQAVKNDFAESMQTRTNNYRKGGGLGLPTSDSVQAQRDLSSLRAQSNKLFSTMDTTIAANINNRTNGMLESRNKALIKEATKNKNADTVSILNDLKSNYEQQVSVGGLLPEQAVWNLNVATDKIIAGRGSLFATDLAKQIVSSDSNKVPDADELKQHIEGVMGMRLTDTQHKLLEDSFNETYYKELSAFNAEERAELTLGMSRSRELRDTYEATYQTAIADGQLSQEEKENLIEQAKGVDQFVNGWSIEKIAKLENFRFGESDPVTVNAYTVGEKSDEIRARLDPEFTGFYSQAKLNELAVELRAEGHTEKTITSIVSAYRKENSGVEKDLMESAPKFMAEVISNNIKNGTPSGSLMYEDHWYDIGKVPVGAVGWLDKMKSGKWGEVVTQTLAELKILQKQNQGVFSEKYETLSAEDRLAMFKKEANLLFQQNLDKKAKEVWGERKDTETSRAYGDPLVFKDLKSKRETAQAKREEAKIKEKFVPTPPRSDLKQRQVQRQVNLEQLENEFSEAEKTGEFGNFLFKYIPTWYNQLQEQTSIADKERTRENREKTDKLYNDLADGYSSLILNYGALPDIARAYVKGKEEMFGDGALEIVAKKVQNYALSGLASMVAEKLHKGQQPFEEPDIGEPEQSTQYRNPREDMSFVNKEGDTVTKEQWEEANRQKLESEIPGVDSGYKPMGQGKYMPTGKGLSEPITASLSQEEILDQVREKLPLDNKQLWLDAINFAEGKGKADTWLGMGHGGSKPAQTRKEAYERGSKWIDRRIKEFETNKGRNLKFAKVRGLLNPNPTLAKAIDSSGNFTSEFQRYMAEQWAPGSVSKDPKFLATLRPAEREKNPNWLANVQKAYSGNQLKITDEQTEAPPNATTPVQPEASSKWAGKAPAQKTDELPASSGLIKTAPKAYLKAMAGDRGIWKEDLFTKPEQTKMRDVVKKKAKSGNFLISYKDWTPEGGSKVGYNMDMPDTDRSDMNLQFTLGKAQIVRKGKTVLVVDEWDIQSPEKIHDMPLWDRVSTIYEKMKGGDTSLYGLAHLLGEAFGPQAGEGASIRAKVGTAKSIGLSKEEFNKIPTLEEYETANAGRINPENLGRTNV